MGDTPIHPPCGVATAWFSDGNKLGEFLAPTMEMKT